MNQMTLSRIRGLAGSIRKRERTSEINNLVSDIIKSKDSRGAMEVIYLLGRTNEQVQKLPHRFEEMVKMTSTTTKETTGEQNPIIKAIRGLTSIVSSNKMTNLRQDLLKLISLVPMSAQLSPDAASSLAWAILKIRGDTSIAKLWIKRSVASNIPMKPQQSRELLTSAVTVRVKCSNFAAKLVYNAIKSKEPLTASQWARIIYPSFCMKALDEKQFTKLWELVPPSSVVMLTSEGLSRSMYVAEKLRSKDIGSNLLEAFAGKGYLRASDRSISGVLCSVAALQLHLTDYRKFCSAVQNRFCKENIVSESYSISFSALVRMHYRCQKVIDFDSWQSSFQKQIAKSDPNLIAEIVEGFGRLTAVSRLVLIQSCERIQSMDVNPFNLHKVLTVAQKGLLLREYTANWSLFESRSQQKLRMDDITALVNNFTFRSPSEDISLLEFMLRQLLGRYDDIPPVQFCRLIQLLSTVHMTIPPEALSLLNTIQLKSVPSQVIIKHFVSLKRLKIGNVEPWENSILALSMSVPKEGVTVYERRTLQGISRSVPRTVSKLFDDVLSRLHSHVIPAGHRPPIQTSNRTATTPKNLPWHG